VAPLADSATIGAVHLTAEHVDAKAKRSEHYDLLGVEVLNLARFKPRGFQAPAPRCGGCFFQCIETIMCSANQFD